MKIVLLGFQTISLHAPQNQWLIKAMLRQVISSELKENRSGQISYNFEEENTTEQSPSGLSSKNYASLSKLATREGDVPFIQCIEVESRFS